MNAELQEKKRMRDELERLFKISGLSQNKFAEKIGFKSTGSLSQLFNDWDKPGLVGIKIWEQVSKFLDRKTKYVPVATKNYIKVFDTCYNAYTMKANMVIEGEGGFGKTFALESFVEKQEQEGGFKVYLFDAQHAKTQKGFINGLMRVLNCYETGTMDEQLSIIAKKLAKEDCLLIIDEASALEGHRATVFKNLTSALKDICGIVFAGTPYLMKNISKRAAANKHLFSELRDRLFRVPKTLERPNDAEAKAIFEKNGITDDQLHLLMDPKSIAYWGHKNTYRGIAEMIMVIKQQPNPLPEYLKAI